MFVLTQKLNGFPSRPKPVFYATTMPESAASASDHDVCVIKNRLSRKPRY